MNSQGRNELGKFLSKSEEMREVRSIRLTNTTWNKLGELANERGITRADLIEEWMNREYFDLRDKLSQLESQLEQFKSKTVLKKNSSPKSVAMQLDILKDLKLQNFEPLTNTQLAKRLGVDGSNLAKKRAKGSEQLASYTSSKDPDKLCWHYFEGDKLYYPVASNL